LSISNLEKVHCTKDPTLKDTQDLSELELKWEPGHDAEDSRIERNVLEQLCPHTNLKSLTIENYEGTSFPNWLGDCSFSNMVYIVLRYCKYYFYLPPLGQLPALKELKIQGFDEVLGVGPFESLEYLSFADMPKFQEWVIFEGEVFPCLQQLGISCCPKLSRGLPNHLPSLTKLEIISCNQLVASLPRAPALHELYCDGKIQLSSGNYYPSLERMTIMGGPDSDWSFPRERFPKLKYIQLV
jgi:hypothetical protein